MPPQILVQLGQDHARLDARPFLLAVEFEHVIQAGDVQDDAGTDGRAGQVGTGRARGDRHAAGRRVVHDPLNIVFRVHQDDRLRDDAIDAGIHRIGSQGRKIVTDFAGSDQPPEVRGDSPCSFGKDERHCGPF